jgi:hypothetical protein
MGRWLVADRVAGDSIGLGLSGTAGPSASLGGCDFFDFFQVLRPESSEEHRPTTILGVLRLRARNPLLSGRSARRFAQDDGLAWSLKNLLVGCRGGEKERRSLGFAANDTGASGPRFSTAPTALSSYSELSPSPSGLGSRLGGRPFGPRIHGDFAVSFLSQLAIGKLADRDDNSSALQR